MKGNVIRNYDNSLLLSGDVDDTQNSFMIHFRNKNWFAFQNVILYNFRDFHTYGPTGP